MKRRYLWSRRRLPVLLVVCSGILFSALAFVSLHSLESDRAKVAFQRVAQERFDNLQSDLDLTVGKVVALGAFCQSSSILTETSFSAFVTPLFSGHQTGIKALEWVPKVPLTQRAAFEESARAEGIAGFEIRDSLGNGRIVRSSDRPYYFPVLYVLPHREDHLVAGFDDLGAGTVRGQAFLQAAGSGELTATERLTLLTGTSDQSGVLVIQPVYGRTGSSVENREPLGFAVGVLQVGDVVEQHGAGSGVDLVVTDVSSRSGQQLYPSINKRPRSEMGFTQYRTISVGSRTWQVTASPAPDAFPVSKSYSYGGSAFCLLFTFLIARYVADTLDQRRKVEKVVDERTGALNSALGLLAEVHRGLEQSVRRYRRLVEDSPVAIIVERQGQIVLVNRAAAKLFGYESAEQILGRCLSDFVLPELRENTRARLAELYLRDGKIIAKESSGVRPDGAIVDVEVSVSSFLDDGQQTIQVILRDITERKRVQAENARLVRAIEQAGESIVITDADANIVYVNPACERISGYSREELLGQNPRILSSKRNHRGFYTELWNTVKSGETWNGRFHNRMKNGRMFTEEASISPVLDRKGELINYVAVKRDVTLEIELQEQLHQSQKMDAIGRLAGGVAHDFNNMLMVILSYAELIADSLPENDPLRQDVEQILHAANRSSALTRQLLSFSRKQAMAPKILDCNAIISETSSMVRRLISENIELKCRLAADLWPVLADADQIVQVILNLCVNSRDAMPNGGTLLLSTKNYHVDQGFIEISVSDTGVGIPPELHEKLFEPFFTTKERGKGTGLGLATVYSIVQRSGGTIRVQSSPSQGTTFTIHLPRCLEKAGSSETLAKTALPGGRRLVLLVEDEQTLRDAIAHGLREHGYKVLSAGNGIDALELVAKNPEISILISDLIMPRMGGRELAKLAVESIPDLNFIFMSGYAEEAEIPAGKPFFVLRKPFAMNALLAHIDNLNRPVAAADPEK